MDETNVKAKTQIKDFLWTWIWEKLKKNVTSLDSLPLPMSAKQPMIEELFAQKGFVSKINAPFILNKFDVLEWDLQRELEKQMLSDLFLSDGEELNGSHYAFTWVSSLQLISPSTSLWGIKNKLKDKNQNQKERLLWENSTEFLFIYFFIYLFLY